MSHTLLLADDSVTIQRVIELTFADEDIEVIAVSDGDQAIARLEASPPDIVLADIGMPGRNGYEVARYIKQSPRLSHIPVVLLTGAFEPVDQARANEAGCDGVLAKPFEPQLVIGRVKDLLLKARKPATPSGKDHAAPNGPASDRPADPPTDPVIVLPPASDPDTAPGATPAPTAATAHIDDYFDRLDAAFEKLSSTPAPASTAVTPPPATGEHDGLDWFTKSADQAEGIGEPWDLPAPPSDADADLPLSYDARPSAFDASTAAPHASEPPAPFFKPTTLSEYAPEARPPSQAEPPTLLDVPLPIVTAPAPVAALEAPAPAMAAAPEPVATTSPRSPAALPSLSDAFAALLAAEQQDTSAAIVSTWPATGPATDEIVERVTRLVLDRLGDRVSHDTVSDIVSEKAERLVREEIDRIKAEIK